MYNKEKEVTGMDTELCLRLRGRKKELWVALLAQAGLEADETVEITVLVWDGDTLAATGSRSGNILKCIAVEESRQGEGLTATVLTALQQNAFEAGLRHLFLYTKPKNRAMFQSLFFFPVAQTEDVLLMENRRDGIGSFLNSLSPAPAEGPVGAAVMNCNPFTKGHRYLIETAAKECSRLYVFVLSEDRSEFSARDRMEMVKLGTRDLENVTVLPTGPYLISSATFPTYFLKDRDGAAQVQCRLDIAIFAKYFAPRFGITRRYVGTEPFSPMTARYNEALKAHLPEAGIQLREVPRLEAEGAPISASRVRELLKQHDLAALAELLPETTVQYLKNL